MEIKPQDIKDFLHLYIGCEVKTSICTPMLQGFPPSYYDKLDEDSYGPIMDSLKNKEIYQRDGWSDYDDVYCKLILRKLSDMTEEDRLKYGWTIEETDEGLKVNYPFESFRLLCKDGWDLFGLIPAGLAIDKTSLKN